MNVGDPLKIRMRRASLAVIDEAMLSSDRLRIAYADKQKGISNAYKKWIGELRGITELATYDRKLEMERTYRERATAAGRTDLLAALDSIGAIYTTYPALAKARDLHVELFFVGAELMRFTKAFDNLIQPEAIAKLKSEGKLEAEVQSMRQRAIGFHKDFDAAVDQRILNAQLPIYLANIDARHGAIIPPRFKGDAAAYVADIYARSVFADSAKLDKVLNEYAPSVARKLAKDPAYSGRAGLHRSVHDQGEATAGRARTTGSQCTCAPG